MNPARSETHFIVLPGGGYEVYAENEAEPIVDWLSGLGIEASVLRYPLQAGHPVPLDAVRSEVRRLRALGATRVGAMGFSAGGHLAGEAGHGSLHPNRVTNAWQRVGTIRVPSLKEADD